MIRLEAVSASVPSSEPGRPRRQVLRRLEGAFAPGESHLVLGANGSGKTTLVRILAGLSAPSEGRVVWGDGLVSLGGAATTTAPIAARRSLWPHVAALLEEPDPQLLTDSVSGEIAFGLESLSLMPGEAAHRVAEAMDRFGLSGTGRRNAPSGTAGFEGRSPRELSAGEKARVLLAAAVAARPRALLLDQTLAHLDCATRRVLERGLVEEALRGERVLVRTHQGEDAPWKGERLQILDAGSLRDAEGLDPEEVLRLSDVPLPLVLRVSASLALRGLLRGGLAADSQTLRCALDGCPEVGGWAAERPPCGTPGIPPSRPDPDSPILLSLERVSWMPARPRNGQPVLRDFSLEVHAGEVVAIVGCSGCGKTTALKLAAGLLEPTRGRVRISPGRSGSASLTTLAMEYPERQLFGRTVLEDVALSLWVRGVPGAERLEQARGAMKGVGLDPERYAGRAPITLSEGEKRRAALATMLVEPAPVLLLDEPTAGLDPEGRRSLAEAVARLRDGGRAIVMASHDLDFVSAVADRVVVMGSAREDGSSIVGEGAAPALWRNRDLLERACLLAPEFVELDGILRERGLLGDSEVRDAESLLRALTSAHASAGAHIPVIASSERIRIRIPS